MILIWFSSQFRRRAWAYIFTFKSEANFIPTLYPPLQELHLSSHILTYIFFFFFFFRFPRGEEIQGKKGKCGREKEEDVKERGGKRKQQEETEITGKRC
jgi:hypothetical protein